MLLTFAHAGHVLVDTLVFGGPVVLVGGTVLLFAKFEQRLSPRGDGDEPAPPPAG